MPIQKRMTLKAGILSCLLLAGACGSGSTIGTADSTQMGTDQRDDAQALVDEAIGEQFLSNECPGYDWHLLQFGTSEDDEAVAIATDGACAVYSAGNTWGTLTVDKGGKLYQDGFIRRLPNGTGSGWTHQFGTDGIDVVRGLAVTAAGRSYAVGEVQPVDMPLISMERDALAASFDKSGAAKWQVTYGAIPDDYGLAVALKKDDSPLVVGVSFADSSASAEVWFSELATADGALTTESLLGTPEYDRPEGVAIDASSGDIFVCGSTAGDMAAPNRGSADVFVRKQKPDHTTEWIYQIGTDDVDVGQRVVRDASGNLYVLALSYSDLVSGRSENDGRIAPFVIKLDKDGHQMWIVRLGSPTTHTQARGLALGPTGELYVGGSTLGRIGSTASSGGWDAYVIKLSSVDGKVKWTKQFGSSDDDYATGLAVSPNGRILLSGVTTGTLPGQTSAGKRDAFVAHLSPKSTEF